MSPDGKRLAYVAAGPTGAMRIFVAPLGDPGEARMITGDAGGLWNHAGPGVVSGRADHLLLRRTRPVGSAGRWRTPVAADRR